jgi:hypothetical protein
MPNYFSYYFPKDVNNVFLQGENKTKHIQNIRLYLRASIALFENSSNKNIRYQLRLSVAGNFLNKRKLFPFLLIPFLKG